MIIDLESKLTTVVARGAPHHERDCSRPLQPSGFDPISDTLNDMNEHDLIGGPFAVIKSDSGVFTAVVSTLRNP